MQVRLNDGQIVTVTPEATERRTRFGVMNGQTQTEQIVLDGVTYTLWYQTPGQREQLLYEYRQKKFGLMSNAPQVNHFGFM